MASFFSSLSMNGYEMERVCVYWHTTEMSANNLNMIGKGVL